MGVKEDREAIHEYAVRITSFKARQLVGKVGFTESDRKDIEQELLCDILRRLPNYDRRRGKMTTFISRVVNHRISTLIEEQTARMRDFRQRAWSLNDPLVAKDGRTYEPAQQINADEYLQRTGKRCRTEAERVELSVDVRALVESLPEDLQDLCHRLSTQSVTDISRETGVPRGTLYDSIVRLRAIFEEAGLQEYLPPSADSLEPPSVSKGRTGRAPSQISEQSDMEGNP